MGRGSGGGTQYAVRDVPPEVKPYLYGAGDQYLSQEDYQALSPEEQAGIKTETVDGVEKFVNPDYIQGLLPRAQQLFTSEMPDYEVAGPTGMQERAYSLAGSGIGAYQPYLDRGSRALGRGIQAVEGAIGGTQQIAGQIPGETRRGQRDIRSAAAAGMPFQREGISAIRRGQQFLGGAAQAYDPTSAQAYMDPYQQEVIDATISDVERAYGRQRSKAEQDLAATAISRGAFSGEAGRRRAEKQILDPMDEQFQRNIASTVGQLRSTGYQTAQQQAQNAFEQQQRRQMGVGQLFGQLGTQTGALGTNIGQLGLQGATGASQLGMQGLGMGLGAQQQIAGMGQGLGTLGMQSAQMGGMAQQMGQADVNLLSQLGAQQQRQTQAQMDAARANAMAPYQQVGFFSDILQGAPIGTMQTSFVPGASPFQQAVGGAIAYGNLNRAGVFS